MATKALRSHIEKKVGAGDRSVVVYGLDRLEMYFDTNTIDASDAVLLAHCQHLEWSWKAMPYNLGWKVRLTVFQPMATFFSVLADAVGTRINVLFTTAELAADFIVRDGECAAHLQTQFLATAHVLHQRCDAKGYEGERGFTIYFAERARPNGLKRPNVPVVYSDMPSKLQSPYRGHACMHLEWRLHSAEALRRAGIASIQDMAVFDHKKFWQTRLCMYAIPSATELGAILAGSNAEKVSGEALRKRARKLRLKHSIGGNFVLQNAIRAHPVLRRALLKVDLMTWMHQVVNGKRGGKRQY